MDRQLQGFTRVFKDEESLRNGIAGMLRATPDITGVQITHSHIERGKDIIFYSTDPLGAPILNACVIKNDKISGSADSVSGANNVLIQATQALDNPHITPNGDSESVSRVYVMSPFDISQPALHSIEGALRWRKGQVIFCCGTELLGRFQKNLPGFLLEAGDLGVYIAQLQNTLRKDDPVTAILTEHGAFADPPQLQRAYIQQDFHCALARHECSFQEPTMVEFLGTISYSDVRKLRVRLKTGR